MYLTLSFDHRLIDGALGGRFTMRVAHYLENYTL
jgi:2-oxoglutarate dehydrogenase E2 component (dihydrolipoamide succinyltransferase)